MKDNLKTYLGCIGWFIVAVLLFKGCDRYSSYQKEKVHETYMEKKRNDSIRKAFVEDSLAHDPHYQDSLLKVEEEYRQWKERQNVVKSIELIGFMLDGDSVYHTTFHSVKKIDDILCGYTMPDVHKLRFITRKEEEENKLEWCDECRSMDIDILVDDGEYIRVEDIGDYVWDNKDEFEYIYE